MKPIYVVHILILALLLCEAKGIRLGNISFLSPSSQQLKIHDRVHAQNAFDNEGKGSDSSGGEALPRCKSDPCTGKARKITSTTISSSTSSSKMEKDGEHEQTRPALKGKSDVQLAGGGKRDNIFGAATTKQRADTATATSKQYPDLVDIVGMDYSPAKRKPPIHN